MMPAEPYTYVSSRLVKEVVALGGSVHGLVPESRRGAAAREEARAGNIEGLRACLPHVPKRIAVVADDESGRRGHQAQGAGRRRRRLRRRGAGLPDAARTSAPRRKPRSTRNFTKYTTNSGTEELKRAVVARYRDRLRHRVSRPAEIIITAGGKQALYNAAMVPVRRRRRSHHAHARLADAGRADQARRRDAGDRAHARRGRLQPQRRAAPRGDHAATRGIIINSPGNPTGALISEAGSGRRLPTRRRGAGSGSCSTSATRS